MIGLFSHSFTCLALFATIMAGLAGCATESHHAREANLSSKVQKLSGAQIR